MVIAMTLFLMGTWYVLHSIVGRAIYENFGWVGGLIAIGAIYAVSLIMHRLGL
jgi:hypothetical protein